MESHFFGHDDFNERVQKKQHLNLQSSTLILDDDHNFVLKPNEVPQETKEERPNLVQEISDF